MQKYQQQWKNKNKTPHIFLFANVACISCLLLTCTICLNYSSSRTCWSPANLRKAPQWNGLLLEWEVIYRDIHVHIAKVLGFYIDLIPVAWVWSEFGVLKYRVIDRNYHGLAGCAAPWKKWWKLLKYYSAAQWKAGFEGCVWMCFNFVFHTKDDPVWNLFCHCLRDQKKWTVWEAAV